MHEVLPGMWHRYADELVLNLCDVVRCNNLKRTGVIRDAMKLYCSVIFNTLESRVGTSQQCHIRYSSVIISRRSCISTLCVDKIHFLYKQLPPLAVSW